MKIGASWVRISGKYLSNTRRYKLQAFELEPMPSPQPGRRRQRHPSGHPSFFLGQDLYRMEA